MAQDLSGKKIAFLVAPEGVEQVEMTEPWEEISDAGATSPHTSFQAASPAIQ
jgi:protease I